MNHVQPAPVVAFAASLRLLSQTPLFLLKEWQHVEPFPNNGIILMGEQVNNDASF